MRGSKEGSDQRQRCGTGTAVAGNKAAAGRPHRSAALSRSQQRRGFAHRFIKILAAQRSARLDRECTGLGEVEGVGADDGRHSAGAGFDDALPTQGLPAPANDRNLGDRVIREHLAHAVAQPDPGRMLNRSLIAAPLQRQATARDQRSNLIEALGVAGNEKQQGVARRMAGKRIEQRYF